MAQLTDYIPAADAAFDAWQKNLITVVDANKSIWGIAGGEVSVLLPFQTAWEDAYKIAKNPTNRTGADVEAKDKARDEYVDVIRPFVKRFLTNNPQVRTKDLRKMDLTVPDEEQTPSPKPRNAPALSIMKIENERHTLRIVDPETPDSKAKPAGVKQTQVWRFIGTKKPAGPKDYTFIGNAGDFNFISEFTAEDEGKKAWYIARYESTRGEAGPWSEPIQEAIA